MPKNRTGRTDDVPCSGPAAILRHRTAIRRLGHSRPVSFACAHGFIGPTTSFFDYGCGLGEDVDLLTAAGIEAEGWDPYYRTETEPMPADCINLGYVLNVIEHPAEREQTLRAAFALARRVLVVAVRVDQSLVTGEEFADGLVTNSGSFQKIYTQREFKDYLESVLGRTPYMASLGIAYVFKDESLEAEHLARLSITPPGRVRIDLSAQFARDAQGERLVDLTRALGRPPLPSEFPGYPELLTRFGTRGRIERLARDLLNPQSLTEAQEAKKSDILTFLSMLKLRGVQPPPFRLLPPETQADTQATPQSFPVHLHPTRTGNPPSVHCEKPPHGMKCGGLLSGAPPYSRSDLTHLEPAAARRRALLGGTAEATLPFPPESEKQ
jgi:DNA phosphorothioation-associated putative methyltransferase